MAPPLEPSVAELFANASREATEAALRSALPGPKLPTRDPLIQRYSAVALTERISEQFFGFTRQPQQIARLFVW